MTSRFQGVSAEVLRLVEAVASRKGDPQVHRAQARQLLGTVTTHADRAALQTFVLGLSLQRERERLHEAIGYMERGFNNAVHAQHGDLAQLCGATLMVAYGMAGEYRKLDVVRNYFADTPPEFELVMGLNGLLDLFALMGRRTYADARRALSWRPR